MTPSSETNSETRSFLIGFSCVGGGLTASNVATTHAATDRQMPGSFSRTAKHRGNTSLRRSDRQLDGASRGLRGGAGVKPKFFATPEAFRAWLSANHAKKQELVVGYYKKGSGRPSITWPQSVDE